MSYSVTLNVDVRRKIDGWTLSAHVIREILDGLDRLALDPPRVLARIGLPDNCLQYDVVIFDDGEFTGDHLFAFTVRYATDEETLFIVDCDHLFLEHN